MLSGALGFAVGLLAGWWLWCYPAEPVPAELCGWEDPWLGALPPDAAGELGVDGERREPR